MLETRRHHADDSDALAIQAQRAPDDVRVTREAAYQKALAKNDDFVSSGLIFFAHEGASKSRRHSERREEIGRGDDSAQPLGGFARLRQVEAPPGKGRHPLEDAVLFTMIEEVG